jgi:hypothetical protein
MCDEGGKQAWDRRQPAFRVLHLVSTSAIKADTKWLYQLIGRLDRDRFEPALACLSGGWTACSINWAGCGPGRLPFSLSRGNPSFREILAASDLLYADGISVVWAGRWLGYRVPQRLSDADYFETFFGNTPRKICHCTCWADGTAFLERRPRP